jgi:hypothetical protein
MKGLGLIKGLGLGLKGQKGKRWVLLGSMGWNSGVWVCSLNLASLNSVILMVF